MGVTSLSVSCPSSTHRGGTNGEWRQEVASGHVDPGSRLPAAAAQRGFESRDSWAAGHGQVAFHGVHMQSEAGPRVPRDS